MAKSIAIVGLPGCGKTTLGKAVAKKMQMAFLDLDELIRTMAGKPILQIFEDVGEDGFRKIETKALKIAIKQNNTIIATGGGIVTQAQNIELLSQNVITIFLDRTAEDIAKDVRIDTRPMMQNDPQRIFELEKQRKPFYQKVAQYTLSSVSDRFETETLLFDLCQKIIKPTQYYVIGTPIEHSLSPAIHTPVLQQYLCDVSYDIQNVLPDELESFVQRARDENVCGFNITMPHKIAIIPYLDTICETAKLLNSVNTVVNQNGKLVGYSTDGAGFFAALSQKGYIAKNKNVVVLGAGGAASAVVCEAAMQGAKSVTVLARRIDAARALVNQLSKNPKCKNIFADGMSIERLPQSVANADILINATSLGMQGVDTQFENFDFLNALPKHCIVCDLIYKPQQTQLLANAQKQGFDTMNGLGMLIYQALIADQYYLNASLCFEKMLELVNNNLQGKI